MTGYVALLRAVNVGGTSKLPMADLRSMAEELGLGSPKTFIASGNLVFTSELGPDELRERLETRIAEHMGKPVPVMIRSAQELAAVAAGNPFADAPGRRVLVTFLSEPPPEGALDDARGLDGERLALGKREIYVDYCGQLLGRSRLRIPAAEKGTARNMNTVQSLAEMAAASA
jgi:uncharacterized protein (DUF1697 family)